MNRTTSPTPIDLDPDSVGSEGFLEISPTRLPRPPAVALRFLQACSEPDVDSKKLARIVSADAALAAEILRVVNSAYFGFSRQIASLSHALSILGLPATRNLVLCVSVRDAFDSTEIDGLEMERYWESAVLRGVAARELARRVGLDPEECFTLGLLQDVGFPILFLLQPERVGAWAILLGCDPDERLRRERDLFGFTHQRTGRALAEVWQFPPEMTEVIGHHHSPPTGDGPSNERGPRMHRIARAADWLTAVFAGDEKRMLVQRARELITADWHLSLEQVDELMDNVSKSVADTAATFGLPAGEHPQFDEVLRTANLALAEANLSFMELNQRLQLALDERDRLSSRLKDEVDKARVIQRSLMPAPPPATDLLPGAQADAIRGINVPARELSGDFFDYFSLRDGRRFFNLADVSGKGMDAALMMAKTSSLLRCLGRLLPDLSRLLAIVNAEVLETSVHGMFVTLVAGIYDPRSQRVQIVNAGHPPPLLVEPSGEIIRIPSVAPPLGIVEWPEYEVCEYALEGASLYLFTDGLLEAPGDCGEMLGYAGVIDLIRKMADTPKVRRLSRAVTRIGGSGQCFSDDVTMLLVEP